MREFIRFASALVLLPAFVVSAAPDDKAAAKHKQTESAEKRLATQTALDATLRTVTFEDTRFEAALTQLAEAAGVTIKPDWAALESAKVKRETPVSARMRNVKAQKALSILLDGVGGDETPLEHYVDDEGNVVITTRTAYIKAHTVDRKYDISDLIRASLGANPPADKEKKFVSEIVTLVMETVDPDSWGGVPAKIEYDKGTLNVRQLKENQRQVANLLNQLRESRHLKLPDDVGGDGL